MVRARDTVLLVLLGTSLSCATAGSSAVSDGAAARPAAEAPPSSSWPVKTREHVDLWLHGYALLQADTAHIPLFRRGYQQRMRSLRQSRAVHTRLDSATDQLRARLASNPALVNGQFLPLYFGSWEDLRRAVDIFFQARGNPNATNDPGGRTAIALIGATFPSATDRDWLRTFISALDDERTRFFRDWWLGEQRNLAAVVTAVDSLWQQQYRAKFQRYLANTQQGGGEMLLSLVLNGEGRTVTLSEHRNAVAVGQPESEAAAIEAIHVFAHEVVNAVTATALTDNTTPAERRSGEVDRYSANVTVRGGALLLQRIAPDQVDGYMRYYLRVAGKAVPAGSVSAPFASAFPVPQVIVDAVARQLDVVLGGI